MASPRSTKSPRGTGSRKVLGPPEPALTGPDEDPLRLPVMAETLQVAKEAVDRGGLRVTKRVKVREELVDEPLRSEFVEVERRPINTAIADGAVPGIRQEGDTLIVPVIEEMLITVKRLVLVEEVRITRLRRVERRPQTYTLRKEHIDVERLAPEKAAGGGPAKSPTREARHTTPARAPMESFMSSVLVGMFDSQASATQARDELISAGFPADAVSLTGGTATTSSTSSPAGTTVPEEPHHEGAIARFFDRLFGGGSEEKDELDRAGYASTYKEAFRRGSYGVSVTAADDAEVDKAEQILTDCGAVDIDEKAESWRKEGWTGGPVAMAGAKGAASTPDAGATRKLQEVEEKLEVGKRTVARGGVRIFTRMTAAPASETVRLREERADVKRTAVDRPATEADLAAFKEGSIEVREMAEEPIVTKAARVTGEVEIGKTSTEREETVHDTLRKTHVDVEQIDSAAATRNDEARPGLIRSGASEGDSGSHPVGTVAGAAAGGVAAGAAAGSVAGPVGTAVGAVAGAVAGGIAGKDVAEKIDPATGKKTRV